VAFAKAMIIHHEGALDMANAYIDDPNADNVYLKKLCLDILVDQKQDIRLMHQIIATYQGDVASVQPSRIDGMDHMAHMGHGDAKPAKATAPAEKAHKNHDMHDMSGHEGHH
jgi:uncharacterized protein (DUF305 family)